MKRKKSGLPLLQIFELKVWKLFLYAQLDVSELWFLALVHSSSRTLRDLENWDKRHM
jgi:hypothetical protein